VRPRARSSRLWSAYDRRVATRLRTAAVVLASGLLTGLGACSWSAQEPGLFTTPVPSPSPGSSSVPDVPGPTDPRLPVAGEAVWTTADGSDVTVRFAVHAVRRTPAATVLDWSVTPLAGPGRRSGEPLPAGTDLGLAHTLTDKQNIVLLDPHFDRAYRPLAALSPERLGHCLCTPLFAVVPRLRFGDTRVLQVAFPPLPSGTFRVDVAFPNVAVVPGVPVTPVGGTPVAGRPVDLTRPAAGGNPVTGAKTYTSPYPGGSHQTVVVNRVVAGPGLTSVVWTLHAVDDQDQTSGSPGPPVSAPLPAGVPVATERPASGPRLRVPGRAAPPVGVRWTTDASMPVPTYECLCSGLGVWSRGLRLGGGTAHLATHVGPLPPRTSRVDVLFPGLDAFTDVRVTWVDDVAAPVQTVAPGTDATWTYDEADPPRGWSTQEWPTPLPAQAQVAGYSSRPERILAALPRG
jgi:hypothetical protein